MTSPRGKNPSAPTGRVVVLATGGTIAGTACSSQPAGYRAAQLDAARLVAAVPALQALADAGRLQAWQVAQVDSKDLGPAVWRPLLAAVQAALAREEVDGVVVTHGTDTLEETACLLQELLAPAKPVVLTAAMRPATDPSADGPANLRDAVCVASWPGARGVLAVMDQQVWAGGEVRKQHTWRLPAFGADAGPLAWVEHGRVRALRPWSTAAAPAADGLAPQGEGLAATDPAAARRALQAALDDGRPWPWVEIVHSHAGTDGRVVRLLVEAGVQGIVVAGTGHGTVHADLEAALLQASERGVPVLRASRVGHGAVWTREGERLPAAGARSPAQARVVLMTRLMARG